MSPAANRPGRLVSSVLDRPPLIGRLPSARAWIASTPVRTKPWSSSAIASASHPVCGTAPDEDEQGAHANRVLVAGAIVLDCNCFEVFLAVDRTNLGVPVHGDPRMVFDLVDQVSGHALPEVIAADEQVHL